MSADRILSQLLGSGTTSGFVGGLAGGLASGLLTSKAGRKLGKKALKVGGIAAEPEKTQLLAHLSRPVDMNMLLAAAATPEIAAAIYTASLLAIDVDTAAERAYLAMLAARLELPEALAASIHRELEVRDAVAALQQAVGSTAP